MEPTSRLIMNAGAPEAPRPAPTPGPEGYRGRGGRRINPTPCEYCGGPVPPKPVWTGPSGRQHIGGRLWERPLSDRAPDYWIRTRETSCPACQEARKRAADDRARANRRLVKAERAAAYREALLETLPEHDALYARTVVLRARIKPLEAELRALNGRLALAGRQARRLADARLTARKTNKGDQR
jgi:hypothetical protein